MENASKCNLKRCHSPDYFENSEHMSSFLYEEVNIELFTGSRPAHKFYMHSFCLHKLQGLLDLIPEIKLTDFFLKAYINPYCFNKLRTHFNNGSSINVSENLSKVDIYQPCLDQVQDFLSVNASDIFLRTSVYLSYLDKLQDLLESDSDINASDYFIESPLMTALRLSLCTFLPQRTVVIKIISELLKKGADVGLPNIDGDSTLKFAIMHCMLDVIKEFLKYETKLNASNEYNDIPLLIAVAAGRLDIVKQLLRHGADVNVRDHLCLTPLGIAIENIVIQKGSGKALRNGYGDFLMCYKDYAQPMEVVRELLKFKANVNQMYNHKTVLEFAVRKSYFGLVQELLRHGANVNTNTAYGESLLNIAVRKGDSQILEALLRSGAEVNAKNILGRFPMHNAMSSDVDDDIPKLLLKYGSECSLQWCSTFRIRCKTKKPYPFSEMDKKLIKYSVLRHFLKNAEEVIYFGKRDKHLLKSEALRYVSKCKAELYKMKSCKFKRSCTLYDVVLAAFTEGNIDAPECSQWDCDQILTLLKGQNYPIYADFVIFSLRKSLLVDKIAELQANLSMHKCSSVVQISMLNLHVVAKIAMYLSNKDLVSWIRAWELP